MTTEVDDEFYDRADTHIRLANKHVDEIGRGKVSASFMYALARFNAWVSACGFDSADEMHAAREKTIDYFVGEYRKMLEENLDDYAENFEKYMRPDRNDA